MSLELKDISYLHGGHEWLSKVSLTLEAGNLYVLLGETDAGKTTLLRLLSGLERPDRGRIIERGRDITALPVTRREVAFVYQQFVNYPSFTVYDNIAAPLRRRGLSATETERKVRDIAGILHIDHLLGRLPASLSGGQQQRVAIARGLVKEAGLVLLDEPLVNLDYQLRQELRDELRGILRHEEQIVVYATTEPDEALQLGGTTIVMDQGRVLQTGPAVEVHRRPASTRVARIFSEPPMNLARARIEEDRLILDGAAAPIPDHMQNRLNGECVVGIFPHRISLDARQGGLLFQGTLALSEMDGAHTFLHMEIDGNEWVAQCEGAHPMRPGARLQACLDPRDLYLFQPDGALVSPPAYAYGSSE